MSHVDMPIFISTSAVQPFANTINEYTSNIYKLSDRSNEIYS